MRCQLSQLQSTPYGQFPQRPSWPTQQRLTDLYHRAEILLDKMRLGHTWELKFHRLLNSVARYYARHQGLDTCYRSDIEPSEWRCSASKSGVNNVPHPKMECETFRRQH